MGEPTKVYFDCHHCAGGAVEVATKADQNHDPALWDFYVMEDDEGECLQCGDRYVVNLDGDGCAYISFVEAALEVDDCQYCDKPKDETFTDTRGFVRCSKCGEPGQ